MPAQSPVGSVLMDAHPAPDSPPPHPSGEPVAVRVWCWTSRRPGAPRTQHEILVHPDWSVSTPHDLALERLAAALGGYVSCLELQHHTVPAARRWLELRLRVGIYPVTFSGPPARWRAQRQLACCPPTGFDRAANAVEHVGSLRHLAVEFECPPGQLDGVVTPVGRGYAADGALSLDHRDAGVAAEFCARGLRDVISLWYAGVHPRRLVQIHQELGASGRLPGRFYLGELTRSNADHLAVTH